MIYICYIFDSIKKRENIMTLGEKIKGIREKSFFTQKELAKELGVSVISIIRWENDQNKPSLSIRKKIFQYCKDNNIEMPFGD